MFRFLHAADIHLDSPLKGLEAETVKLESLGVAIGGRSFAMLAVLDEFSAAFAAAVGRANTYRY
jgi:hypothetical protein